MQGAAGNIVSPDDSANYLLFLALLRSSLPPSALITAAVAVTPFASSSPPTPLTSVAAFSAVLDYILLMDYDVWGASDSNPGPNAPLSDACGNSTQPNGSAVGAIRAWTTAGFEKGKILLGVPSYGYVQNSAATTLRQRRGPVPLSPEEPADILSLAATAPSPASHRLTGIEGSQIQFVDLVKQGVVPRSPIDGTSDWASEGGFQRYWDACSSTVCLLFSVIFDFLITAVRCVAFSRVVVAETAGDI